METREEIEGAEGDVPALLSLRARNAALHRAELDAMAAALRAADFEAAASAAARLTFYDRIEADIWERLP